MARTDHTTPLTLSELQKNIAEFAPLIREYKRNRIIFDPYVPEGKAYRLEPETFGEQSGIYLSETTLDKAILRQMGIRWP